MRLFTVGTALAAALLLTAGGTRAADSGWGTVKGQIVFEGDKIPERPEVDVAKAMGACKHVLGESWVVNPKNKGVQNVIVWLVPDPASEQKTLPINPALKNEKLKDVVMDQPNCAFIPHAVALRKGQNLVVKNSAKISHNVNWTGNPLVNVGGNVLVSAGGQYVIKDLKPQKLPLKVACTIHPWMNGWVAVFDHPYYAITDKDGQFEIKGAPAGKCNIMVWQESIGYRGGAKGRKGYPITVKAGGPTDLGKLGIAPK